LVPFSSGYILLPSGYILLSGTAFVFRFVFTLVFFTLVFGFVLVSVPHLGWSCVPFSVTVLVTSVLAINVSVIATSVSNVPGTLPKHFALRSKRSSRSKN
jgi:hypothetical protein